MSEIFEIIVFTASHSCYANVVLNILDPQNEYITFRLFRDHCLQTKEGIFIKDLRIIANRSLKNIAIVDNATYSFGF
jgi:CTD small phosphatase-like protein 2